LVAAAAFLSKKTIGRYHSFYDRAYNKARQIQSNYLKKLAKASLRAQRKAAAKQSILQNNWREVSMQAPAGMSAAHSASENLSFDPDILEPKKIAAQAKAEALAWLKKYQKKLPRSGHKGHTSAIVNKLLQEASGVKVSVSTEETFEAGSTMKVHVKVIDKDGKAITGTFRSVPAAGHHLAQHFPSKKALEGLKEVQLRGSAKGHTWLCSGATIRLGPPGGVVINLRVAGNASDASKLGFWVNGTSSVTLVPDTSSSKEPSVGEDSHGHKKNCLAFRATKDCNWNGTRVPHDDKSCTSKIQSSQSGYCQCASGMVGQADCGHHIFTCKDLCKA